MAITVNLPSVLAAHAGGTRTIQANGRTLLDLIDGAIRVVVRLQLMVVLEDASLAKSYAAVGQNVQPVRVQIFVQNRRG